MMITKVNLQEKFGRFREHWSPKIAAEINDSYLKLVKFQGEFVWHNHAQEDELFLVVKGEMRMGLRENGTEREVVVGAGEFIVIPRGTEHRPAAYKETQVILLEPRSTLNTGNVRNERTLAELERI